MVPPIMELKVPTSQICGEERPEEPQAFPAGQLEHALSKVLPVFILNLPLPHLRHSEVALAPTVEEYVPPGQLEQTEAPTIVEYLPLEQGEQVVKPLRVNVPMPQDKQEAADVWPEEMPYLPLIHSIHELLFMPMTGLHFPGKHSVQVIVDNPITSDHLPAAQGRQVLEVDCPIDALYLPATHCVQLSEAKPTTALHFPAPH